MQEKSEINMIEIVEPLLQWYEKKARILPWRENTEPYRVWISEIMLQQTRVEAVKPYFQRFMRELPDIQALAQADENTLLKLWEGLGYYNRVRNMQKAAQMIATEFRGYFPDRYEDILRLPGIGEYTAGAISSISFGKPIPAVDGNVLRVVTRLTEDATDVGSPSFKKATAERLKAVYPAERCGDFTQSLMELGAVVCLPNGEPLCNECPVAKLCLACRNKTQMDFPVKAAKKARRKEEKTVFLLNHEQKLAICRRGPEGLLAGLWELPNQARKLTKEQAENWLSQIGVQPRDLRKLKKRKHIFTHVEWDMAAYYAECETEPDGFLWVSRAELESVYALPTAFRQFLADWIV